VCETIDNVRSWRITNSLFRAGFPEHLVTFFFVNRHSICYNLPIPSFEDRGISLNDERNLMHVRLKVVKGKPQGHFIKFPNGEFMFGRGPECDIRPNSDLISRQHCLLRISDTSAIIRDLGSRNGTLVNGQLVLGERILENGDSLQLGPLVLEVIMEASLVDTELVGLDSSTKLTESLPL